MKFAILYAHTYTLNITEVIHSKDVCLTFLTINVKSLKIYYKDWVCVDDNLSFFRFVSENYPRMTFPVLNKSLKQYPTKMHLLPLSQTIHVKITIHENHYCRRKDKFINDDFLIITV